MCACLADAMTGEPGPCEVYVPYGAQDLWNWVGNDQRGVMRLTYSFHSLQKSFVFSFFFIDFVVVESTF